MSRMLIGTLGWSFPEWDLSFYPDDIPEDWKLTFYANEFSAVVLPEVIWAGEEFSDVVEMVDELDESFRIYCLVETSLPDMELINQIKADLGQYFAGFIVKSEVDLSTFNMDMGKTFLLHHGAELGVPYNGRYWAAVNEQSDKPLSLILMGEAIELRGLRQYFEAQLQNLESENDIMILLQTKSPNIQYLHDLRTLIELMAIA